MSSYTPRVKAILTQAGCTLVRQGRGDHEVWQSPLNGKRFTVDGNIQSRHTANGTLKDAGLPKAFSGNTMRSGKEALDTDTKHRDASFSRSAGDPVLFGVALFIVGSILHWRHRADR